MKRTLVLGTIVVAGGLSLAVAGLQGAQRGRGGPQEPPMAQMEQVRDNLYMLTGGGGNTAAFIRSDGVVLVDTKLANWGQAILDKVRTVTDKPITTIINTHTHGDHTGSNSFFTGDVEFVAHANTKANMERMDAFKGDGMKFLPSRTFDDRLTLGRGADQVDLYYFGRGHTSGDAIVVFPALRAMHSGDLFAGKNTPIIDAGNGGSAVEYGESLAKAHDMISGVDTIITGHSTVMNWNDLGEYAQFNRDFITWVRGEMKAGKSVEEAAKEYAIPSRYPGYTISTLLGGIQNNIQVAYDELR